MVEGTKFGSYSFRFVITNTMRFMTSFSFVVATATLCAASTNNSIAELGATIVINDEGGCENLCSNVTSCAQDPNAHGSYCKFWQDPPVCFGMYQNNTATNTTDNSTTNLYAQVCFQPNDPGCDDLVLPPITCPNQVNTTCARVCQATPDCLNDPQHGGSFCKLESNVCFGLYWTSANRTEACYQPPESNSTSCPTSDPVKCDAQVPFQTTTISPESTSTSEGETTTTPQEESTTEITTESPPTESTTTLPA